LNITQCYWKWCDLIAYENICISVSRQWSLVTTSLSRTILSCHQFCDCRWPWEVSIQQMTLQITCALWLTWKHIVADKCNCFSEYKVNEGFKQLKWSSRLFQVMEVYFTRSRSCSAARSSASSSASCCCRRSSILSSYLLRRSFGGRTEYLFTGTGCSAVTTSNIRHHTTKSLNLSFTAYC